MAIFHFASVYFIFVLGVRRVKHSRQSAKRSHEEEYCGRWHRRTRRKKCLSCKNTAANVGPINGKFKSGNARVQWKQTTTLLLLFCLTVFVAERAKGKSPEGSFHSSIMKCHMLNSCLWWEVLIFFLTKTLNFTQHLNWTLIIANELHTLGQWVVGRKNN